MLRIKRDTLYKTFVLGKNRKSLACNEIEIHVFNIEKFSLKIVLVSTIYMVPTFLDWQNSPTFPVIF